MSANVISLSQHFKSKANPLGNLTQCFAEHRKDQTDVYWLKENAELLNIFECSDLPINLSDFECYKAFYQTLPDRIAFFPQYYRFLASIALDLEALGMEGQVAEQLCQFISEQGLAEAELSDLQRAEAMRLLARRDITTHGTNILIGRLHAFMDQSCRFALPNRKLAYELTHIVFYLSEYGRRDPKISTKAVQSLMFTGILAHLEENADLLSEVCISLRYAGQKPPKPWEDLLARRALDFDIKASHARESEDQYHEYFVTNWAIAQSGGHAFTANYNSGGQVFYNKATPAGVMRALSQAIFERPAFRCASWEASEHELKAALPDYMCAHLENVIDATSEFDAFFEHFARPTSPVVPNISHPARTQRGAAPW
jgi:hypothetical protein